MSLSRPEAAGGRETLRTVRTPLDSVAGTIASGVLLTVVLSFALGWIMG